MPAFKLVLHPSVASVGIEGTQALLEDLKLLGLLGEAFQLDQDTHFRTGPSLLDRLTFLGCAPTIALDPPAADLDGAARRGEFVHIHLWPTLAGPILRRRGTPQPRCRQCRSEVPSRDLTSGVITCNECGIEVPLEGLNWRQAGAYARVFLDIWGVHPAEAVPGDELLATLGRHTRTDWGFCYLQD